MTINDYIRKTRWLVLPLLLTGIGFILFEIYILYMMCEMPTTITASLAFILLTICKNQWCKAITSLSSHILDKHSVLMESYFSDEYPTNTNRVLAKQIKEPKDIIESILVVDRSTRIVNSTCHISIALLKISSLTTLIGLFLYLAVQYRFIFMM